MDSNLPKASAEAQIKQAQYQTIIRSADHTIIADEPIGVGADTGMSPHTLLLASLGSCTAITLRMYINHKEWKIEEISVKLDLYKTNTGTQIERELHFIGELTTEQCDRLIAIANACPIHKILKGNIEINTH